jgi:hypothetical protein
MILIHWQPSSVAFPCISDARRDDVNTTLLPRVAIPNDDIKALKLLAHASLQQLDKLQGAIAGVPPPSSRERLEECIAQTSETTRIEEGTVRAILGVLWKLSYVRAMMAVTVGNFVTAVGNALKEKGSLWGTEDTSAWEEKVDLIQQLLAPENPVSIGGKAGYLMGAQQYALCEVRVFTDARPIFNETIDAIVGIAITHNLTATYHEGDQHKSIHVTLNSEQLAELKTQVARAEQKENVLRHQLQNGGFTPI